jgi:hypothetical protein
MYTFTHVHRIGLRYEAGWTKRVVATEFLEALYTSKHTVHLYTV